MKIAYCSDLHLEVGKRDFELPEADLLLLVGDICVVYDLRDAWEYNYISVGQRQFFLDVSAKYKNIIWIPGNHEYWHNSLSGVLTDVNHFFDITGITNITFLESGVYTTESLKIVCATLWTDVNKGSPLQTNGGYMRDYENISVNEPDHNRLLTVSDTMALHKYHKQDIADSVQDHDNVLVVTHHAPNMKSCNADRYGGSDMDYYYGCTDMDDLILDNPQIKNWIHGHTHTHVDYSIGDTRILSNPRGYAGYEPMSKTFKIKVIEL
jgi:predicted phosphohydrolase